MAPDPQLLAKIVGELPLAIWVARVPDGELVCVNDTFHAIMGAEPPTGVRLGELAAGYRLFTEAGHPYPEGRLPFVRAIEAGRTVIVDDIVVHRPDGLRLNARCWGRPLYDDEGVMTQVVVAFADITREKRAEAARAEAEQRLLRAARMEAVGQLAGGIALDFNNLLATVQILASTLRLTENDPVRRRDLEQVQEAATQAVQLTRALQAFSGPSHREREPFSVHDAMASVVGLVSRSFEGQVEIRSELRSGRPVVAGSPPQLEQALMNLALHARDRMPDGGTLTFRTTDVLLGPGEAARRPPLQPGWHVMVEVVDDGDGLAPGLEDKVFEPYAVGRVDGAPAAALGLATAFGVVLRHGGTLDALPNEGGGVTMRILLPTHGDERPKATPLPAVRTGSGLILVVDDEPLVRAATETGLRALGYAVITAEDGVEAVELFRAHRGRIDAVILDLVMPRMGGQETLRTFLAMDPSVRVLLTTGLGLDEGAPTRELGAQGYLAKPFGIEQLSDALAQVLGRT